MSLQRNRLQTQQRGRVSHFLGHVAEWGQANQVCQGYRFDYKLLIANKTSSRLGTVAKACCIMKTSEHQ